MPQIRQHRHQIGGDGGRHFDPVVTPAKSPASSVLYNQAAQRSVISAMSMGGM
jgi:hypothetical protein